MNIKQVFKSLFTGNFHLNNRKPCQDYASYRISKDDALVLCLSDGASGGKYSDLGSKSNVNAVLGLFQRMSVEDFLKLGPDKRADTVVRECLSFLNADANRYGIDDLNQLSATLVIALITNDRIYVAHIGDGIIAAKHRDGSLKLLTEADNINGQSNRTHFTCEYNAQKYYREELYERSIYTSILVCSDGPYNDIQADSDLNSSLQALLSDIESGTINNNIDFNRRVNALAEINDDWSILALSLNNDILVEKN